MSVWREGSDIQRLNAAAGEHPVPVSPEVREVLRIAHQVSEWTDGKFDVTFAALSGLWKFDAQDKDNTIPDRAGGAEASAADRLSRSGGRRSRRHGVSETEGDARQSGRHRQGLRDRSRRGDPARPRTARLHDPGGRRSVRRGPQGRSAVARRHPRSARARRPELRGARSLGQHLQYVRRLRAVLHEGRADGTTTSWICRWGSRPADAAASRS